MEFTNTIPGADVTNLAYCASQIIHPNDLSTRERDVYLVLDPGRSTRIAILFRTWKHYGELTDELSEPPQFSSLKPALSLGPPTRWTRNKRPVMFDGEAITSGTVILLHRFARRLLPHFQPCC